MGKPLNRKSTNILCLFDFDGTITHKDSFIDFIICDQGLGRFVWGMIVCAPVLALYVCKIIPNGRAKQFVFRHFFGGVEADQFQKRADRYSLDRISRIQRRQAIERLAWHQQRGHQVVVVSASIEAYLKAWCARNGFDLIGTLIEVKGGIVTGNFTSKNCYGSQKVGRILEKYDLNQYDQIYAYGDSKGDREMLSLADEKFYGWKEV
jgi:HAD superfamily hydrolase (TIGR01490 family)